MNVQEQISKHISDLPGPKSSDMLRLHQLMLQVLPGCQLWFDDGKSSDGKVINNPTIGYGLHTIQYADGRSREVFQIGISGNTTGISVYILGIKDKTFLAKTCGKQLGKAKVTGYCIKFKTLNDINIDILESAIRQGVKAAK